MGMSMKLEGVGFRISKKKKKKEEYCFTHTPLNCVTLQDVVWWIPKIYSNSKGDWTK